MSVTLYANVDSLLYTCNKVYSGLKGLTSFAR